MDRRIFALTAALAVTAPAAFADFAKISGEKEFKSIVAGKMLTRPLVRLQVSPEGWIDGTGATWKVTGNWSWRGGYFCRDLTWGGSALGYNCQEVRVKGGKIRFTSDRGKGDFADFNLRSD